ncbi:AAA family ATPase [Aquipuribacter nitratireducens]|uniref:Nuclease SbcCD subunit C n=1 Tax=Aquipuribacter nitratireducens TaxID=650104 RepID=A0ABW0GIJ7_9MICO
MRPHRLRVTAFGPFPGRVEVDLDELSSGGPFLLHGPTGAGKTSLLDAIGFALFGRVPGARGQKQLRSHHAAPEQRTEVELWASLGDRAVHITRTPDQERPKTRGSGTTKDRASVAVEVARDLAGLERGDLVARWTGVQEANDELQQLVGMSHEQFFQVVVLPQGQFAQFLRATDDDRAAVLRRLFDTARFGAVEQRLKERARTLEQRCADAARACEVAAAHVSAHAGLSDEGPPDADRSGWGLDLLAAAGRLEAAADAAASSAAAKEATARAALELAREAADLLDARHAASSALAALEADGDQAEADRLALAAADRAAPVAGLHAAAVAATTAVAERRALAQEAIEVVRGTGAGDGSPAWVLPTEIDGEAWQALVDEVAERVRTAVAGAERLAGLGADLERLTHLVAGRGARDGAVAAARRDADHRRRALEGLPARVRAVQRERETAVQLAAGASQAEVEAARYARADRLLDELLEQVGAVADAERAELDARAAARAAESRYDAVREGRLRGMAAELATSLTAGEPCAVCGATEHPAPARPGPEPVDAGTERVARAAADDARAVADRVTGQLADARSSAERTRAALAEALAPDGEDDAVPALTDLVAPEGATGLDALRAEVARRSTAALARGEECRAAQVLVAHCGERLAALDAEEGELREGHEAARHAEQHAVHEAATAESEASRLAAGLATDLGVDGVPAEGSGAPVEAETLVRVGEALEEARTSAADEEGRADSALTALHDLASAAGRERAARAHARTAAHDHGWEEPAEAAAAARPAPWCDTTRARLEDRDRRCAEERRRLTDADARLTDLLGPEVFDAADAADGGDGPGEVLAAARSCASEVPVHEAALVAAGRARREADSADARAADRHAALRVSVPRLVEAERAVGPLRETAREARRLADLCSGSNDKGIPLSTYVLAAHLEHVVSAANVRLGRMSDGRYALEHVDEGEDRRRRAGLGLAVLDGWTGTRRPAGTLSGGETFLASLALALGLSDVVTAEAGGTRVDALFVDEGFGTLDPEALDRAMDVLDGLREHGRVVGIVSHVDELRRRLPTQLHVHRGRDGSSVEVLTAALPG